MIVAIDGPSGVGKSTVAKLIAARLSYTYLDSGALYRAVAWKALTTGTDPADSEAIRGLCATTQLKASSTVGGGMVVDKSLRREADGLTVHFDVTDTAKTVPVVYKGILPDLFKEGKGVVARGKLELGCLRLGPAADLFPGRLHRSIR